MKWSDALIPGRMPLVLAWFVCVISVPIALVVIASRVADTAADRPVFVLLVLGSAITAPLVARSKGRRWWLWGLFAAVGALASPVQPLVQPVTVAIVLLLAGPAVSEERIPQPGAPPAAPDRQAPEGPPRLPTTDQRELPPPVPATPPRPRPPRSRGRPRY